MLWNHPSDVPHQFRDIADPFKCYNDDRVKKLFELIKYLGDKLSKTHASKWSYLVHAVVDVYKQKKKYEEEAAAAEAEDV